MAAYRALRRRDHARHRQHPLTELENASSVTQSSPSSCTTVIRVCLPDGERIAQNLQGPRRTQVKLHHRVRQIVLVYNPDIVGELRHLYDGVYRTKNMVYLVR